MQVVKRISMGASVTLFPVVERTFFSDENECSAEKTEENGEHLDTHGTKILLVKVRFYRAGFYKENVANVLNMQLGIMPNPVDYWVLTMSKVGSSESATRVHKEVFVNVVYHCLSGFFAFCIGWKAGSLQLFTTLYPAVTSFFDRQSIFTSETS